MNNDYNNHDFIDVDSSEVKNSYGKKNKKGMGKKILSYILIGVISASLGGTISAIGTIKYYNNKNAKEEFTQKKPLPNKSGVAPVPMSVSSIVKQVGPAVVGVSTKSISSIDMFGFPETQEGMGSGIIFNEDGYILTNYHVINGARQISVILNNGKEGKEIPAKVVNYNSAMDLAVIKLTEKVKLPAIAEFGDSDNIEVGDPAVAIGNPLGKQFLGSVTYGVISAVNRKVSIEGQNQNFIQTDAAINPGNSGGALVNTYGQVIGINSAKIGGSQVEGLGFAIPINAVKPQIQNLIKPILKMGIMVRNIDDKIAKQYKLPVGIYVQQVEEFSPAEKAGITPGDIIIRFDRKTVKTVEEMNSIKQKHNSGDVIEVEVNRDGKNKTLKLTLSE
ncbi:trypsin-like serine protease [Clostridium botulinum C]|uniref:Trypsin-like serine protease n=2 Tax=Clostridium botulinum TaxID=1491 RepID=A0A9Q4XUA4_CLOBO|nr:trypsin-like peptidase domain-containing protein [Clostridium botulinum]MCD3193714.1 trypsin-like serine protease [Clostridium botulinum C]MCD3199782.1 trypsin-like serine protease [Clostridium botulinum C]MCD3205257.1 trypsin-like serine protease [Clostridium botulinum C]MCD3207183.1 trypsin-like serine protease [Clostridium botulinum C]MCD3224585.1 trypsin-like serine protease [Clostridium botulinum C]